MKLFNDFTSSVSNSRKEVIILALMVVICFTMFAFRFDVSGWTSAFQFRSWDDEEDDDNHNNNHDVQHDPRRKLQHRHRVKPLEDEELKHFASNDEHQKSTAPSSMAKVTTVVIRQEEIKQQKQQSHQQDQQQDQQQDHHQQQQQRERARHATSDALPPSPLRIALDSKKTNMTHRVLDLPMATALRQFRQAQFTPTGLDGINDGNKEVVCMLVIMQTNNCDAATESLAACVDRIGTTEGFERILGERCIGSKFWKQTLPDLMESDTRFGGGKNKQQQQNQREGEKRSDRDSWKRLSRGVIWDSQIWKLADQQRYVPPAERTYALFPPPRVCTSGRYAGVCKHYPIGFAVPRSYYVDKVPRTKTFDWMPSMPKFTPRSGAYEASIEDEDLFREMYSQSYFAWTHSRAGWDCMRHYEIFAAGSVPYFFGLEKSPRNTLGHLPKQLLLQVQKMAGLEHVQEHSGTYVQPNMYGGVNFKKHGIIEHERGFNLTRYYEIADGLLEFGKKHLTSAAVVSYLLKTLDVEHARNVLIFDRDAYDYLSVTLLAGFADLGINTTVVSAQQKDWLFKMRTGDGKMRRVDRDRNIRHLRLHGAGFGFMYRLPDTTIRRPFFYAADNDMHDAIAAKKFDLVLYSNVGDAKIHLDAVESSGTKVAAFEFRDGFGDPSGLTMSTCLKMPVFIREMSDRKC